MNSEASNLNTSKLLIEHQLRIQNHVDMLNEYNLRVQGLNVEDSRSSTEHQSRPFPPHRWVITADDGYVTEGHRRTEANQTTELVCGNVHGAFFNGSNMQSTNSAMDVSESLMEPNEALEKVIPILLSVPGLPHTQEGSKRMNQYVEDPPSSGNVPTVWEQLMFIGSFKDF